MAYTKKVKNSSELHLYSGYIASIARETDDDGSEYLLVDNELYYEMLYPEILKHHIDLKLFAKQYGHLDPNTVSDFLDDEVEEVLLETYFDITGKEACYVIVEAA